MKKINLLGVALLALFVFSALTAVSASALTYLLAEWLLSGTAITTENLVEIEGELTLTDSKAILGSAATVLCSGFLDGWVGPNSLDWVSEILSLNGQQISTTSLTGLALECEAQTGCEKNTKPTVWAVNLPWESEAELLEQEGSKFFLTLLTPAKQGGEIGWDITNCLVLGTAHEDVCTTPTGVAELKLEGTTLIGGFSTAFTLLNELKLALCTASGEETGEVAGSGKYIVNGGGELTASSESEIS